MDEQVHKWFMGQKWDMSPYIQIKPTVSYPTVLNVGIVHYARIVRAIMDLDARNMSKSDRSRRTGANRTLSTK